MGKAAVVQPVSLPMSDLHNVDIITPERRKNISNNYDFFSLNILESPYEIKQHILPFPPSRLVLTRQQLTTVLLFLVTRSAGHCKALSRLLNCVFQQELGVESGSQLLLKRQPSGTAKNVLFLPSGETQAKKTAKCSSYSLKKPPIS